MLPATFFGFRVEFERKKDEKSNVSNTCLVDVGFLGFLWFWMFPFFGIAERPLGTVPRPFRDCYVIVLGFQSLKRASSFTPTGQAPKNPFQHPSYVVPQEAEADDLGRLTIFRPGQK